MDLPRNATLVIMRGEPGSGKSKQAKELKEKLEKAFGLEFFSTDNIFYNADGEYEFVSFAIGAAHAFMRQELIFSLCERENTMCTF